MNLFDSQLLKDLVISEMEKLGYHPRRDEIKIVCPFHNDSNPSCHVMLGGQKYLPGTFHCFSCGASGGWNKLAAALSLKTYANYPSNKKTPDMPTGASNVENPFAVISDYISSSVVKEEKIRTLEGLEELPARFSWRGLSRSFLLSLGAKYYWDKNNDIYFLYLPITKSGIYQGYTLCALKKGFKPKYQLFVDSSRNFLLYDQMPVNSPIVITEGHFDALRLFYEGIPAVALFGVENWSATKKEMLIAKNPRKVIICMDGDDAGKQATIKIFESLRAGALVDVFWLPFIEGPEKMDPGNMPSEYVEALRNKVEL